MTAISTSNTPSTLAQALAKLGRSCLGRREGHYSRPAEVAQLEKSQTSSTQGTGVNVIA
jgi:hypothetical protein